MKKWSPWIIIGVGVIILLWLTRDQFSAFLGSGQAKVPYLVPQPLPPNGSTNTNTGLSEQSNIIGSPDPSQNFLPPITRQWGIYNPGQTPQPWLPKQWSIDDPIARGVNPEPWLPYHVTSLAEQRNIIANTT